jgi:hypothetical protein
MCFFFSLATLTNASEEAIENSVEMAEFEAALTQIRSAIDNGDVTEEDLEAAMDMQDMTDDAVAFVESGADKESVKCAFDCNDIRYGKGWYPYPRPNFKPSFNGCGADGDGWFATTVRKTLDFVPKSWTKCCNAHDVCYGTCKKAKHDCDNEMLSCMTGQVRLFSLKSNLSNDEEKCVKYKLDKVFYQAVNQLGCSAYQSAQKEACECRKKVPINLN